MMQSIERLQRLLLNSSSLLPSLEEVSSVRLSMTTEWICQKLISLAVYMHYYFDHFLFLEHSDPAQMKPGFYEQCSLISLVGSFISFRRYPVFAITSLMPIPPNGDGIVHRWPNHRFSKLSKRTYSWNQLASQGEGHGPCVALYIFSTPQRYVGTSYTEL